MVSKDTVDRIDGADDLSEVWKNPSEQATELAPTSTQGAVGEIAPEEDFKTAQYGFELGVKTLTQYDTTYLIPEGVVFTAPMDAWAFEALVDSVALYEQALIAGLRFSISWFLRELLFFLGLAHRQLMLNV